jgi:hypothetical protein
VRKSLEQYESDEVTMAFASVETLFVGDTLTALTVPGFQILLAAIFDKQANLKALQAIVAG